MYSLCTMCWKDLDLYNPRLMSLDYTVLAMYILSSNVSPFGTQLPSQAVFSYCTNVQGDCEHDIINTMCKILGEKSGLYGQYVSSNYVEPSSNIMDIIRKSSFTYMKRCVLLWKMLSSAIAVPYSGKDVRVTVDSDGDSDSELKGVGKLENMFKIPSIEMTLKDKFFQISVFKWVRHFQTTFQARNLQRVFYSAPVVPFQLMHLPHEYENLLYRYMKQCCPRCKARFFEPALCLLCGKLCSTNSRACCSESKCQSHAMASGAGIGVFLLIKRTRILLQRNMQSSRWPSPYLDANGAEDFDLERGRPLLLNEER